jgi:hypothetical protein
LIIEESPQTTLDTGCDLVDGTAFEHGTSSHVSSADVLTLGDDTQDTNIVGADDVVTLGDYTQDSNNVGVDHLLSDFIGTPASDDDDTLADKDELAIPKRNLGKMFDEEFGNESHRCAKSRKHSK